MCTTLKCTAPTLIGETLLTRRKVSSALPKNSIFVSVPFDVLSCFLNEDIIFLLAEFADYSILRWITSKMN